jgi:transcriptional regulator with XRE-family HTH domain
MSDLQEIRRQIRAELADPGPTGRDLDPEIGRSLDAAIAGLEPTDEWLEAVDAIVERRDLRSATVDSAVSNAVRGALQVEQPNLVALRDGLGLSIQDAATQLGISRRAMEQIEGSRPLGWLRVRASVAASYLDSLGVRRADFLRWLATLLATRAPHYAYGYRPGERPTEPLISDQDNQLADEFRGWAVAVLAAK